MNHETIRDPAMRAASLGQRGHHRAAAGRVDARRANLNGANLVTVKGANRSALLLATRELQPVSRVALARVTGLNASTVSKIVGELAGAGLLIEEASTSRSGVGRPTRPLRLNASARHAVGVDISRDAVAVGLVNLAGEVVAQNDEPLTPGTDHDSVLVSVLRAIRGLLGGCTPEVREHLLGIGVGAPGPLRRDVGTVVAPPNFPQLVNVPVRDVLAKEFGLPTFLENDANACALAEQWFGAARDVDSFVYMAVGTGVGAGVVVNGQLYRGHSDLAGEIGHTSVDPQGPRCDCGNRGCLELFTSERRVVQLVEERLATSDGGLLPWLTAAGGARLTPSLVYEAAAAGDPLAREVLADVGFYLGVGIVNVINVLDPEAIVIGRGMAAAGRYILDPVRAVVSERAFPGAAHDVRIQLGVLGSQAPVIGAATLVLSEYYANPLQVGGRRSS